MEDKEFVCYDAHVKTHQRHILLSWLESAKTEKIRKLKEEKTNVPNKKIALPKVEVSEEKIDCETIVDNKKYDDILVSFAPVKEDKLNFAPLINKETFESINQEKITVAPITYTLNTEINKNQFSSIQQPTNVMLKATKLGVNFDIDNLVEPQQVKLPDEVGEINIAINSNEYNHIKPEVVVPAQNTAGYNFALSSELFSNIPSNTIEMPEAVLDLKPTINLGEITENNVTIPKDMNDFKVEIKENNFEDKFAQNIDLAVQKPLCSLDINHDNFKAISQENIALPKEMADFDLPLINQNDDLVINSKINIPNELTAIKFEADTNKVKAIPIIEIEKVNSYISKPIISEKSPKPSVDELVFNENQNIQINSIDLNTVKPVVKSEQVLNADKLSVDKYIKFPNTSACVELKENMFDSAEKQIFEIPISKTKIDVSPQLSKIKKSESQSVSIILPDDSDIRAILKAETQRKYQ